MTRLIAIIAMLIATANIAHADGQPRWWLGGHTPEQGITIGGFAIGTTYIARKTADIPPISWYAKTPHQKAGAKAVLTLAASFALWRLSERMAGNGAAGNRANLFHGPKDSAIILPSISFSLYVLDYWKAEKKRPKINGTRAWRVRDYWMPRVQADGDTVWINQAVLEK